MTNNISGIDTDIRVNGQKLESVTSFKYLGSVIFDEGSKLEIAQTTAALTRLKPVWNDSSISLSSKNEYQMVFISYFYRSQRKAEQDVHAVISQ